MTQPESPLMSVPECSEYLHTAVATLYSWRSTGDGPPSLKLGRRVFYRRAQVDRWLAARERPGKL